MGAIILQMCIEIKTMWHDIFTTQTWGSREIFITCPASVCLSTFQLLKNQSNFI